MKFQNSKDTHRCEFCDAIRVHKSKMQSYNPKCPQTVIYTEKIKKRNQFSHIISNSKNQIQYVKDLNLRKFAYSCKMNSPCAVFGRIELNCRTKI